MMQLRSTMLWVLTFVATTVGFAQPAQTFGYHETESSEHLQITQDPAWNGDHLMGKSIYALPNSGTTSTIGCEMQLDRVAADGSLVWTQRYNCGLLTRLGHVEPINEGTELLAVGGFRDFNSSIERAFVMRIDASTGAVLDQKSFTWTGINGFLNSRFLHAIESSDSGYYVAGWYGMLSKKDASKHAWVVKLTDALAVDWQRSTESVSYDNANFYDWDMANHVTELSSGGVVVSGSINAGPEAVTPTQSAMAWCLDGSGNTEWVSVAEFQSAGQPRMVGVGTVERNGQVVQVMNGMMDLAFSLRVLDATDGHEINGKKFSLSASGSGGGKPRAFEMDLLPSGDLLVGGYVKDHVWEKLDSLGQPSGVMAMGNVPFIWQTSVSPDWQFTPSDFEIFLDHANNAGEWVLDPFVSAFSPSNMSYIYYPDMLATVSETDRSLTGYRNQWDPHFSDQTWIPAPSAATLACEVEILPTVEHQPDWSPGQEPTIETDGPDPDDLQVNLPDSGPVLLDCDEIGTPDCNPYYEIGSSFECLDGLFTATPDYSLGFPTSPADMTFMWTTSDGGSGTGATFSHTFPSPGSYDVTLTMNCVWSTDAPVTITETFAIVLSTDCVDEPCEILFADFSSLEQVSCGPFLFGTVEAEYYFIDDGTWGPNSCIEWYVDGALHPGPDGSGQFTLLNGHHEVCLRVSCCENPSIFNEECHEITVGSCPEPGTPIDFTITNVGASSGFCSGCVKTLEVPYLVTNDLADCVNLYWDFSWSPGEISATNMSVCLPTLPISHEICLVARCEPTPFLGAPAISYEMDRICKPASCWTLTGPILDWTPSPMAFADEAGCGVRFALVDDNFEPLKDRVAVMGWWGGAPSMPEAPSQVPYPALMMDFGWAVVDAQTGEPVVRAEGAAELELDALLPDQIPVFILTTPSGVQQFAFPDLVDPFDCGSTSSIACAEDVDGDGTVAVGDLLQLLSAFGDNCP